MTVKKCATKKVAEKAAPKATTEKVAAKAVDNKAAKKVEVKVAEKKPCAKRSCAKKAAVKNADYINAESAGFRAGDVYQALAAAGKALTVAEIATAAKITKEEVLLGLGWLLKEGKVKGVNVADICLA